MVKKNTTFNMDTGLMKEIRLQAVKQEVTQTELITRYLIEGLKADGVEL